MRRIPLARDINRYGEHVYSISLSRYGDIEAALDAARFDAHSRVSCGPGEIGTEALLNDLRRLEGELGDPSDSAEIDARSKYSLPTYYNDFESLGDALDQAGLTSSD